jgi:hypothetical protein
MEHGDVALGVNQTHNTSRKIEISIQDQTSACAIPRSPSLNPPTPNPKIPPKLSQQAVRTIRVDVVDDVLVAFDASVHIVGVKCINADHVDPVHGGWISNVHQESACTPHTRKRRGQCFLREVEIEGSVKR